MFQLFQPKNHVLKKASPKVRLVSIKCNFWKKLCFILVKRTRILDLELFRSILPKVRARFDISIGVSWAITKLAFNKGCLCLQSLTHSSSFLSSHLSALRKASSLTPLISSLSSALSVLLQASPCA